MKKIWQTFLDWRSVTATFFRVPNAQRVTKLTEGVHNKRTYNKCDVGENKYVENSPKTCQINREILLFVKSAEITMITDPLQTYFLEFFENSLI